LNENQTNKKIVLNLFIRFDSIKDGEVYLPALAFM